MSLPMIAQKESFATSNPLFRLGLLVRHRRYGYRGVIVALNTHCEASELWYQANQSQPNREQPWYHVLVDGRAQTTYAAQSNLEVDGSSDCIVHPWVDLYFDRFEQGHYIRNDKPWPYGPPD